jgi:hypothetical protein
MSNGRPGFDSPPRIFFDRYTGDVTITQADAADP